MGGMIPLHLSLSGFLSYREPVELDFSAIEVACISGPNGAGKSSLLDALTWALFGQARKRDDSLINSQSGTASVALTFAYEGNLYRILRSKPRDKTTVLEFDIWQNGGPGETSHGLAEAARLATDSEGRPVTPGNWKPITERTLRDTEARIQQTLRLDYDTFVNAAFFLQGKADLFTQQRPADRKRILSSILGLDAWEDYRKRAGERRKAVEVEISALDGRLHEINLELAEEPARRARLATIESELKRLAKGRAVQEQVVEEVRKIAATLAEQGRLVEALGRQVETATHRLESLERQMAERQGEQASFAQMLARATQIEAAYQAWEQARAELETWEAVAARFREHEKRRQGPLDEINAARARLLQEQQTLLGQAAIAEDNQPVMLELGAQIEAASGQLEQIQTKLDKRTRLEADLKEAHRRQAEAKAENPRLKKEMDELKARLDQLSAAEGAVCPLCGQPLSPDERTRMIGEMQAQGTQMGDRYRTNQALLREADQRVGQIEVEIQALAKCEADFRQQTEINAQLNARLAALQQADASWKAEGLPRLKAIGDCLGQETFAAEARSRLAKVDAELKAIGYDAAAHDEIRRAELAGRGTEGEVRALERARATLAPLEREIAELQTQRGNLLEELAYQRDEHTQAAASLAAAQAQAPDLLAAERELFNLQEQENQLRMEVGAADQKVRVLDDLKVRSKTLEAERAGLATQVGLYRQLERAFGKDGVPALLIEQALPQIETRANEILARLSQGNMSVRFATQAAYKDKHRDDLRETLDILISDGAGTRDYEMYSGGEAFRVNFAIRLALSEVLAQRAGARLQTLVIDEGFGSQDAQGRQRLIEAINLVRPDFAKILVITHIDELKDAFPTRIEVEKTALGSTVRVI
jgi:exonuclease SbcC